MLENRPDHSRATRKRRDIESLLRNGRCVIELERRFKMGKIESVKIENFGPLKNIVMGR